MVIVTGLVADPRLGLRRGVWVGLRCGLRCGLLWRWLRLLRERVIACELGG